MIFDAFPEAFFPIAPENSKEYCNRIEIGESNAKKSSVIICGLVRNAESIFPYLRSRLEKIGSFFSDYQVYLYENDSTDSTKQLLWKWSKANDRIVFCGEKLNKIRHQQDYSLSRREDMAMYRNRYIDAIKNRETDYVIVLDTDIEGGYSYEGILHSLSFDLDVIASNSIICRYRNNVFESLYYDAWAFRALNHPEKHDDEEINKLDIKKGTGLFEVFSAFGGLAIYKAKALTSGKYRYTNEDCDHTTLHEKLRKAGYKIYVNPSLITLYSPTLYTQL